MSRSVVAQGSFTSLERCDCGSVYLTVGPICMKLHPDALPELRETLARATRAFERERRSMSFVGSRPGEAAARDRGEGIEGDDERGDREGRGHTCDPN
jgi:hypothetical protein